MQPTYRPSKIARARKCGFRARSKSAGGPTGHPDVGGAPTMPGGELPAGHPPMGGNGGASYFADTIFPLNFPAQIALSPLCLAAAGAPCRARHPK